eukprot:6704211-Prorocentrum_lima.AAC.1
MYPSPPVPSTSGRRCVSDNNDSGMRDANFLGGSGVPWGVEGPATETKQNNEHAWSTVRQTVVKRVVGR